MGGRMCTRKDVAEHAGVSVTTVSNVLNHSKEARPEIVERVKKAAKELNYHPNLIAKGLKMNNSMQVGVIISEINNPYRRFTGDRRRSRGARLQCEHLFHQRGYLA